MCPCSQSTHCPRGLGVGRVTATWFQAATSRKQGAGLTGSQGSSEGVRTGTTVGSCARAKLRPSQRLMDLKTTGKTAWEMRFPFSSHMEGASSLVPLLLQVDNKNAVEVQEIRKAPESDESGQAYRARPVLEASRGGNNVGVVRQNFGGYLADEMWAAIFNREEIQANDDLRRRMLDSEHLDFESVYDEVVQGGSPEEREGFQAALEAAFAAMHAATLSQTNEASSAFSNFLSNFEGSRSSRQRGFFFSLNQDLLVESSYIEKKHQDCLIKIPGLHHPDWFTQRFRGRLTDDLRVALPEENEVNEAKEQFQQKSVEAFSYIKLHGSYGWRSEEAGGALVVGKAKTSVIEAQPLLAWYFQLFQEVLCESDRNLVVIGYGFGEEHINAIIQEGVDNGLRLYVISPKTAADFREMLIEKIHGETLWKALAHYHQGTLEDFSAGVHSPQPTQVAINLLSKLGTESGSRTKEWCCRPARQKQESGASCF